MGFGWSIKNIVSKPYLMNGTLPPAVSCKMMLAQLLGFVMLMNQRRQIGQIRRMQVKRMGRPLTCPLCRFTFNFRRFYKDRRCPKCKVPVGFSWEYRVLATAGALLLMGKIVYSALLTRNFALVMLSMIIGLGASGAVLGVMSRKFPPKLQAHAEGHTWLSLK
jgi:hypothetical protein